MNVQLATADDIPAIMALERQCPEAAHWTESQYRDLFEAEGAPNTSPDKSSRRLALKIVSDDPLALLAFLIAHNVDREWELENIAVAPTMRRKGLATQLIQELLKRANDANGETVFLEVRESNQSARHLYGNLGFAESGRRKAYYQKPLEDAIVYRLPLRRAPFSQ